MTVGADPRHAARLLRAGECVALPTETVYGLAARADDPAAVRRIFEVKGRPASNPLILHLAGLEEVEPWVEAVPDAARRLAERFWPGPLTLLLPHSDRVAAEVRAGRPRVAVRVPGHELFREVIRLVGAPLAAPSANPSGYVSPTTAQHVALQLGERVPFVLDGGPCARGVESTIVGWEPDGRPTVYRPGAIPLEELDAACGGAGTWRPLEPRPGGTVEAPGMLPHHYAPHTPVVVSAAPPAAGGGWITWSAEAALRPLPPGVRHRALSRTGDLEEAARHLYAALIELDAVGLAVLHVEPFPQDGLGATLGERVRRASLRSR